MTSKRIVVLANSRKHAGRCIAGREIAGKVYAGWVRPVSNRPGEEVSEYERQYENGADPKVLDIVDIPVTKAVPHACQTENWQFEPDKYWEKVGSIDWAQARQLAENPPTLWINNIHTGSGMNDEMPTAQAAKLPNSICMIHVAALELHVVKGYNKRRVQAWFTYLGVQYRLWVTDPDFERTYLAKDNGTYPVGESLLVVSLGEPFTKNDGTSCQYKLVATILRR